jgi:LacI family transcriptional regulator
MVNIKDVAKRAGVSIATVSHVINETRFVTEETKAKVRSAMAELEYIPNISALSLRTQKTRTVGLLIPILKDEANCIFFMQVALGAESVLKAKGYFMFLSNTNDTLEQEIEEIKNFNTRQIDGLIVAPAIGDHRFIDELVKHYQVVFVDRKPNGLKNRDCVISDTMNGCYNAIKQLIELGHRKIAIMCGELGKMSNADERYEGYIKALSEYEIPIDPHLIIEGESSLEAGYEMSKKLLSNKGVTSLFITSNIMAMGAMKYIQEQKIKVPEDLSITVFDDYNWTQTYNPALTVIRQHAYELGKKSAEIMLTRMDNQVKPKKCRDYRLSTEVIVRQSWAPARKED